MAARSSADRRVAAEWEPQECLWIAWPHNQATWPGRFKNIPSLFAKWIHLVSESLPVRVLADDEVARQCQRMIGTSKHVEIIDIPTNDCWVRDYGPTFILSDTGTTLNAVTWRYNAWGGKYPPWDLDASAGQAIADHSKAISVQSNLCLEGGALEFDGGGRLLTTPCLLEASRNPDVTKQDLIKELKRLTGVTEILWVQGGGLAGDDTDGHIDQLARFIDRENIVVCTSEHDQDAHAVGLKQNLEQIRAWSQTTTPRVTVHELPAPQIRYVDGQPVPQSYCNFLRLGPDRMLVPGFGAPEDEIAAGLLKDLSNTEVTLVDCRDLAWGLGALHCASRDQPSLAPHEQVQSNMLA